MNASLRALALAAALLGTAPASASEPGPAPRPSARELAQQLGAVEQGLRGAEENLRFVETQYTQRTEPSEDVSRERRFSDGEIQYLLGDWPAASVLFYDLVSEPRFKSHPRYTDALFYLADSLLQQKNYIGARLYLREMLSLPITAARYRDALSRFLVVAGRLNHYEGVDAFVEKARALSGGQLPPEMAYVYAKWLFRRTDLPPEERLARARAAFIPLAQSPDGAFRLQAAYHLGVLSVQAGDYPGAIQQFQQLAVAPAATPAAQVQALPAGVRRPGGDAFTAPEVDAQRVRELALMSLGRLQYETGRYDEALDTYSRVPRDSQSFPDSLYEVAWVHVKMGHHQLAKNAIDILLMVAPDSQLAPEARLLHGNLLQKLHQYAQSIETYEHVISTFSPVRDTMDNLLRVDRDPVVYFDRLLARTEASPDVSTLLPPLALRYATTEREVTDAIRMVGDIDSGRKGAGEAQDLAKRILQALDTRGLETFPELQEGYTRADAVDSALIHAEASLVRVEGAALEDVLTPAEREQLAGLRREREALGTRFGKLPTTIQELEERRQRMQARVDSVDREAFRLGYELRSLEAVAASIRKWVDDTRLERKSNPDEEREFLVQLQAETQTVTDLQAELDAARARLADERNAAATALAGEQTIRSGYAEALSREHALLDTAQGRLSPDVASTLVKAHEVRAKTEAMRARVATAREVLRGRVEARGRLIREKVVAEQELLNRYDAEVAEVTGNARNIVGRIAYESFRRVRQQFYDLVLKADVGVVDVSFTEKQDRTTEIQKLSAQKDKALHELDAEFRDVLVEEGGK
ncbi:tetratricopeptide repeat protein [Pyxidicoccus parkwayensis]|uniref:Tetratricopeptide repeat protein n=1 Tax=Pyxidicoccus parkwayensis TaxID=2813578 RepID=A0ABX7NPT2_9BACT|nr:tetratricopeptide repeat protein [Pyxidicoccus parkwaysis]QSQ19411.1 tetratricopeptide repeat protein [Pyxidicoccus parkwaysis]